jgi:alkanesulfonate monooxygenase SsuD/methylene tetrahydromethanopterin reductase-like flavin-dependent oxidoreductase (luciferase family)
MRVGIGLPAAIPNVESSTLVHWALRAEQRGFDSIGVVDRVRYDNHDPLAVLAAAAAVTERVELLTDILIAPLRDTALLAKQAATVDRLSRGRLTLGVGIGGRADDYAAVGLRAAGRGRRLEEQLGELRRIWSGSSIGPEPAQPGGPPLLVAAYAGHAIERAARAADGWTAGVGTLEQFAHGVDVLLSAWRRYGRVGRPRVLAMAYFALGPNARGAAEHDLLRYYGWLGPELSAQIAALALTEAGSVGEWLAAYAEAGAGEALLVPTSPELEQVDLLADAVAELRPSPRVVAV